MSLFVKKPKCTRLVVNLLLSLSIVTTAVLAQEGSITEDAGINTLPLVQQPDMNTLMLTIPLLRMPEISTQNLYTGVLSLNPQTQQYQVLTSQKIPSHTGIIVDPDFPAKFDQALRDYLDELITTKKLVGAAIRVDIGEKSWRGVQGHSRESENKCCDKARVYSQRFRIGSITKMFTASVVFALIREGSLTLDDTLEKWFSQADWYHQMGYDTNGYGAEITLRHLLGHTSGIPNYTNLEEFSKRFACHSNSLLATYRPEDMLLSLATDENRKLISQPGQFAYSNTNYLILGLLIEQITELSLAENIHRHILIPSGLFNTTFPDEPSMPDHFAHGYGHVCDLMDRMMCKGETLPKFYPEMDLMKICASQEESGFFYKRDATFSDPSLSWAAGALISSVDDLATTVRLQVKGEIPSLPEALLKERYNGFLSIEGEPCPEKEISACFGLGLMKIGDYLGHGGLINGYASVAFYNPQKDITVALNVNQHTSATAIAVNIIQVLESIEQGSPKKRNFSDELKPLLMNGFTLD